MVRTAIGLADRADKKGTSRIEKIVGPGFLFLSEP